MICNKCGKQLQEGISFCTSCGGYVNHTNKEFNIKKEPSKILKVEEKKPNKAGKIIYLFIILLWLVAIYFIITNLNTSYYFEEEKEVEKTSPEVIEQELPDDYNYEGVSKSGIKGISGLGTTAIIHDNQYMKQMTFNTIEDVETLIRYDSVNQKVACPVVMKGIEDEAISKYQLVAINFCEMDTEFAYELVNVISYIYTNYPSTHGYMTNITLANVDENTTYMAAFMPLFTLGTSNTSNGYPVAYKTQIILNAKYFLDTSKIESSASYGSSSGYFPKNATRSSTVAHEFGHFLSYVAMLNSYNTKGFTLTKQSDSATLYKVYDDFNVGTFSYKLLQEAYKKYTGNLSFDDFRGTISKYAIAKDKNGTYIYDETIAEAFHDVYLNKEKAKEASKLIVSVLESYL